MSAHTIAFCTTCKGRVEHLKQTLPQNLADNPGADVKFVVLDYNSQDDLLDYLKTNHAADIACGRLAVYSYREQTRFHVAHAKNMAARCGILEGADILVTLDADNFTGPNFAEFIREGVFPGIFLCPDFLTIKSMPWGPGSTRPLRGYAGRLAIRAKDFIKVGGYDEVFDTWRGEDMDLVFRLKRMGYTMRFIENHYLGVISHSEQVRFAEYPEARQYDNREEVNVIRARTETVVNSGKFGCGKLWCNFGDDVVEFTPLPTRIFGIGMQKTATTTLHHAFEILGFDSFHWGTGEAPLIWQEMNAFGRSNTLERWYALSDNPIPLLYRELDKAYPGSKFILTVRDEWDWLMSVERLWSYKHNPTRKLWDVYPFSNHIHTVLYGQRDFDTKVFLERYRRHNAEVKEYFKDRPNDLLVLDIPASHSWKLLCSFLGEPIPSVGFPWGNKTENNRFALSVCTGDEHDPDQTTQASSPSSQDSDNPKMDAAAVEASPSPPQSGLKDNSYTYTRFNNDAPKRDCTPSELISSLRILAGTGPSVPPNVAAPSWHGGRKEKTMNNLATDFLSMGVLIQGGPGLLFSGICSIALGVMLIVLGISLTVKFFVH